MKSIEGFIDKFGDQLRELGEMYPEKKSLILDYKELELYDRELADRLRKNPVETLVEFDQVLNSMSILTVTDNAKFYARFRNMPKEKGYNVCVRDITSEYIGKFISVDGTVNRMGDVYPKVENALFVCNVCDEHNWIKQEKKILIEPYRCKSCGKNDFRFIPEESQWIDIQELQIQEPLEMLKGGENARTITLWSETDMTDRVTPGDTVVVTGIVRLRPPKNKNAVYDKFIEVNHIETMEQDFEDVKLTEEDIKMIRQLSEDPRLHDKITDSIAPSIYGYRESKEAISLQLFGGRQGKLLSDGTRARGDIHLLLIGDPGVAKSRLLTFVDKVSPKSIYVTGKGTTGAGLTATAEKDELKDGAWTLKAGALVLAGGGIGCIDEFDKMGKEDRSAMHEAMEQQTISVAKAGIICKFKANTSILAAANPKFSRFDDYKPIPEQFDIPPTLISRFDLIFPVRDMKSRSRDKDIADHILRMHSMQEEEGEKVSPVQADLLKKYIAYARREVFPLLTEETKKKISDYYVDLRDRNPGGAAAATPRQLEAIIRLAEASAKLRLSKEVSISDVERAIKLTEFCLKETATDPATGELDIDRIDTSHSKSVRDRIRLVEEALKELTESSPDNMASLKDIIEVLSEKNIDRFEAEKFLNELRKKGEIYEPRHGMFMFVED